METYNIDPFVKQLSSIGLSLSEEQINQFLRYYELLVEWNEKMNLTAITEFDEVIQKHFIDSLLVIKSNYFDTNSSLIDVGTGAGFPGIPLKIAFPELQVTLLDSLNKRVGFLQTVINELKLDHITAIHSRAEDGARNIKYREQFDFVVSRAVANLSTLSEYCLPFVKVGGFFISYKASDCDDEVNQAKNAITKLSGSITDIVSYDLPDSDISRKFIVIEKTKPISKTYPRKAGLPSKAPLQ